MFPNAKPQPSLLVDRAHGTRPGRKDFTTEDTFEAWHRGLRAVDGFDLVVADDAPQVCMELPEEPLATEADIRAHYGQLLADVVDHDACDTE